MKCPHCLQNFHASFAGSRIETHNRVRQDPDGHWNFLVTQCPACERFIIFLQNLDDNSNPIKQMQVWPKGVARSPLPSEVPTQYAADYREACIVLSDSAKASAALSRRCLQHLLREEAKTKKRDLFDQIGEVIPTLPSHLAEAVDAVRNIGNFAAHPLKSTNTGEILDVEPGEAEWNLEVLEGLFDFYFVQPAILKKKRDALNTKLAEAQKPPMK